MNPRSIHSIALGFALVTTLLSGCGSTGLSTVAAFGATNTQLSTAAGANAQGGQRGGHGGHESGRGDALSFLANLGLSADQQTALAAITAKYQPAKPAAEPSADAAADAALQAALTASTIDDTALRTALAAREAQAPAAPKDDNRVALLSEVRALLTDTQRAAVVAELQAAPAGVRPSGAPDHVRPSGAPSEGHEGGAAGQTLTADQQAKLDAFQAALKPATQADASARPDPRAGELAFWQTGDTSGLVKPAMAARPAFPVDAFVAFAESLDLAQRQAMFAQGHLMAFGGHEGRGGGHGGGRGGHGDFDGPGGMAPAASPSPAA